MGLFRKTSGWLDRALLRAALAPTLLAAGCLGSGDDALYPLRADGGSDARSDAADAAGTLHEGGGSQDATMDGPNDASSDAEGPPQATFSATSLDFGGVNCGATQPATKTLEITNSGSGTLAVSASLIGSAFTLSPTSLSLGAGASGTLTLGASVPTTATAGTALSGSLVVFTNDPQNANHIFPLSVTPTGATFTGTSLYVFTTTPVGESGQPVAVTVTNTGNATGAFSLAAPTNPQFSISDMPDGGTFTLMPGQTFSHTGGFLPTSTAPAMGYSLLTTSGAVCGNNLFSISFTGQGVAGTLGGYPSDSRVDFGSAYCGGVAPAAKHLTLTDTAGGTSIQLTMVDTSGMNGFTTDAVVGATITPGNPLDITLTPPAISTAPTLAPVTGRLVLQTSVDTAPVTLTLSVEPLGAVLAFDTSPTQNFGSFGSEILLESASQTFNVKNTGNVAAPVTLVTTEVTGADAGLTQNVGTFMGDDGGADLQGFSASPATFVLSAAVQGAPSTQQDLLTFRPVHANVSVGTLALHTDTTTPLCAPLPRPLPLTGTAVGAGVVVQPTSLAFPATCGGSAPTQQSFVVANAGTVDMNWQLGAITGPAAANYTLVSTTTSGLLIPGASTTIVLSAKAVPSPATSVNLADLAAQITVTTDVPFDPTHVVNLGEVPLGDQLSVSAGNLRFGQVPVGTSIGQDFTVVNNANAGSPAANVTLSLSGTGTSAYSLVSGGSIAPGGTATEHVTFDAANPAPYRAAVQFSTTDALCTPLPGNVALGGTGTSGALALSAGSLVFGTDPHDPNGFVNCGSTGSPQTLVLTNVGNQAFNVTGLALGKGTSSPFTLSGAGSSLPLLLAIGSSAIVTVKPSAIPSAVANPNDPSAYSDVLTVATDATGDTPHAIPLVMQPHGAIITGSPAQTGWTFGTVSAGSIGTFTAVTIQNTGNAPATVSLENLTQPTVFGLENNPTTVSPNAVSVLVGQFTPPSEDGNWIDQGQLVVTAPNGLCEPLPTAWQSPTVNLTGASNARPIASISGSLLFPTTSCGDGPPAGQSVHVTSLANQAYQYKVRLASGRYYTLVDSGSASADGGVLDGGTTSSPDGGNALAGNGVATIVVNPKSVPPGPGVLPGSAPYADDLVIDIQTSPVTTFTVPISWTLNGAVLSLPDGTGPGGQGYYVADGTSGFALAIDNHGNATGSVGFAIQPSGSFSVQPASPVEVLPNIRALPELVSGSSSSACPSTSGTVTPNASATFLYSGPVCQPLGQTSIQVYSCSGTFPQ
jgi:hypothetical protein